MVHKREVYWDGHWKQVTVQVSKNIKWCVCKLIALNLLFCSLDHSLWLHVEWLKIWWFYSPAAALLSYLSSVGREQEGTETCLSSSADLLCNPCPSPWIFAPQALLESFTVGDSNLSKARLSKDPHVEDKTHLLSLTGASFLTAQSCCFGQWTLMTSICLGLQAFKWHAALHQVLSSL